MGLAYPATRSGVAKENEVFMSKLTSSSPIRPLFGIQLDFEPLRLKINPPKGWTYEAIVGGGTLYKVDAEQTVAILISEETRDRTRLKIVAHSSMGSDTLYDAVTVNRKARSDMKREISRVFANLTTIADELAAAFGDLFTLEMDVVAIDADLPPPQRGKGITEIARLTPKDASSPIEYLSFRQLRAIDSGTMLWVFHKLKMPYPQLFENAMLPELPGFAPIYFTPFDITKLEESVRVFMATDWKSELTTMLRQPIGAQSDVQQDAIDDANRFLAQA